MGAGQHKAVGALLAETIDEVLAQATNAQLAAETDVEQRSAQGNAGPALPHDIAGYGGP